MPWTPQPPCRRATFVAGLGDHSLVSVHDGVEVPPARRATTGRPRELASSGPKAAALASFSPAAVRRMAGGDRTPAGLFDVGRRLIQEGASGPQASTDRISGGGSPTRTGPGVIRPSTGAPSA